MQIMEKDICAVGYHILAVIHPYKMCKMITVPQCTYLAAVGSMSMPSHWLTVAMKGNATAVKKNLKQKK